MHAFALNLFEKISTVHVAALTMLEKASHCSSEPRLGLCLQEAAAAEEAEEDDGLPQWGSRRKNPQR